MKIGIVVQTRMGSSRLPGKVMKKISGKTVISHVIERLKQCKHADEIIIATTTSENDNVIAKEAEINGVNYFRGSEEDVLSRYYLASLKSKLDIVVRITSDCPMIDPRITDSIINFYKENDFDIVSNAGSVMEQRTFPRGLDTEVFSFKMLEEAYHNAKEKYQREHVTPYIYENSKKIYYYKNKADYSKFRWTLDTEEDLILTEKIYEHLYKGKHDFYMDDIIGLFEQYPDFININSHIEQKKLKE